MSLWKVNYFTLDGFIYGATADVVINGSFNNPGKTLKDHKIGWNQVLPCVPSKEKGITISLKHDIAAFSPWAFVLGNVPGKLPWKLVTREEQCCLILNHQYIMRCPGRRTRHTLLHLCLQSLPGFPFTQLPGRFSVWPGPEQNSKLSFLSLLKN